MKISTRISFTFSILSSLVLVIFGSSIYFYTKNYTEFDFTERLKKRVEITENFFLEKTTFSKQEFEKIKTQFSHTLNDENEEVIEIINDNFPQFKYNYSKKIQHQLYNNSNFEFEENGRQGASKIFNIANKKYLIIVTAFNEIGENNLAYLLNRILFLVLFGVPILFFLSIVIAKRILLPISKKIEHANQISATNLHERLEVINAKDELGQMAIAFNSLLDRLEKSFDAQKSFISNASHEIRNPLTAIMGEAEIASSKGRSAKEYLESFSIILSESERLNLTVNNLLQLSKVNANESVISLEKIKISSFILELIESYGFINLNNKLTLKNQNNDIYINGNKNLLKTAIINLLDNACKFSANKEVLISIIKKEQSCLLIIKDFGIGIPKSDLDKIANPFYRASNAITIKGSGIGLVLSKKIIELHNGKLEIESIVGKETKISIVFPIISF